MSFVVDTKTVALVRRTLDALATGKAPGRDFPTCLPDGSDVSTVAQVAAMMGVGEKVAAFYVLEQKGLCSAIYAEAKGLTTPPKSDEEGVAIMLMFPPDVSRQIAIQGGTPPEQIHITVGYFGKINEAPSLAELQKLCAHLATMHQPFKVRLSGLTRFSGKDRDAFVVNVASPDVEDVRRALVLLAEDAGLDMRREHGYTPHVTLGYLEHDDPVPMQRWQEVEVPVTHIVLGYGDNYEPFTLYDHVKDVHSGSLGTAIPNLRTHGYVAERFSGRVRKLRAKKKKPTS